MEQMKPTDLELKIKREKEKVIILSVVSNTALVILKIAIGLMTGLVSIVAEALHSANDLMASLIAYFGVKQSLKPADKDHQYGHGKIEIVTGWIENILIFLIGVGIVYEGVMKLVHRTEPTLVWAGIAVMIFSGLLNWTVSRYLIKKGKELRSVGITVDGEHLNADVITSLGIAGALIALALTKVWWIDPVAAIFVGVWVIGIFVRLSVTLTHQIIDRGLDESEIAKIEHALKEFEDVKDFHRIRTRQSGSTIFIDMHVKVDGGMTVLESHDLTHAIEMKMKRFYGDCNTLVHIEPFRQGGGGMDA
ncbi:MAG: cation diffusion facilitator family transporter [Spirochaetia bacterium]|nr:cation diffusion facilitator family transporter [Spirochaetia bacterium]